MEITLQVKGKEHTFAFLEEMYRNKSLAIRVFHKTKEEDYWSPWCNLTVCIPDIAISGYKAFLDTNNCSREIIDWILENDYANVLGEVRSGYKFVAKTHRLAYGMKATFL